MYLSFKRWTLFKFLHFGVSYTRSFIRCVYFYFLLKIEQDDRFDIRLRDVHICLRDATGTTGFDRHYIYHTSWAARVIAETRPTEHFDFSSSLFFVGIVSAFVPVRFFDYRPAALGLSNLTSESADLVKLPFDSGSLLSVSCMHVIEHIGLGRYGDNFDYYGDIKAINELKRVTALGGQLLLVVPVGGKSIIQFNAHRIYKYKQIVDLFYGFKLMEFALIPDMSLEPEIIRHATECQADLQKYACGCFRFVREE